MSRKTSKSLGRGLGKGLGSLLGEEAVEAVVHEDMGIDKNDLDEELHIHLLRIIDVEPNASQPRSSFDEEKISELAESIERHGVLQPITVRRMDNNSYQIIAGERRWRAARKAGLREIPAIILKADDLKATEIAMVENLQREDLNPVEEAEGYRILMSTYLLKQEEVAQRVGKSRSAIANSVRLLSLESSVLTMLRNNELSGGHARTLLTLPAKTQILLAERIVSQQLSVRQAETLVKKIQNTIKRGESEEETAQKSVTVDYVKVLQQELGDNIGRKVKIVEGKRKGRIEIEYYGNDDLSRLVEMLSSLNRS